MDTFQQDVPNNPLYYACMHVRIKDRLAFPSFRYATSSRQLHKITKRAIPKGSIIYIMSDLHNRRYLDFLEKDYILHFYFDFPQLNALVSEDDGHVVDNAMLYSVEKNILEHAYIKIVPSRLRPKIIYSNYSLEAPWRYKILAICHYLFRFRPYNLIRPHKWPKIYRDIQTLIKEG